MAKKSDVFDLFSPNIAGCIAGYIDIPGILESIQQI